MDVRIEELHTTITDTGAGGEPLDGAMLRRIVRAVIEALEHKKQHERRVDDDRRISSPDQSDVESYG